MKKLAKQELNEIVKRLMKEFEKCNLTNDQVEFANFFLSNLMSKKSISYKFKLTERETSCLFLAALGKTSIETAKLLNIQPYTVQQHRQKLKRKLHSKSMAEAVLKGVHLGFINVVGGEVINHE